MARIQTTHVASGRHFRRSRGGNRHKPRFKIATLPACRSRSNPGWSLNGGTSVAVDPGLRSSVELDGPTRTTLPMMTVESPRSLSTFRRLVAELGTTDLYKWLETASYPPMSSDRVSIRQLVRIDNGEQNPVGKPPCKHPRP